MPARHGVGRSYEERIASAAFDSEEMPRPTTCPSDGSIYVSHGSQLKERLDDARITVFVGLDPAIAALEFIEREVNVVRGHVRQLGRPLDDNLIRSSDKCDVLGVGSSQESQPPPDLGADFLGAGVEVGYLLWGHGHRLKLPAEP